MEDILFTIALVIFAGIASQLLASKFRFPAIVPLLIIGAAMGQLGILNTELLGGGLNTIVHIGVAIILFEGGLSLRKVDYQNARSTIRNLITIGLVITWVVSAGAAYLIFPELQNSTGARVAILFGALVTVTGPTVIMPLLKSVKTNKKISTILTYEGILIDPIGAILAVVILTYIETAAGGRLIVREFVRSLAIGLSVGVTGGVIMNYLNKRRFIPWELRNLFVLSAVIVIYAISDWLQHETGVLAVTVTGMMLGVLKPTGIDEIESFKGQLTTLMVSLLFIILAANLDLIRMINLGWHGLLLLAIVIFIVRPLNVFASTINSDLNLREKFFLSWIAPRGIVAAAVASLFATNLAQVPGYENQAVYLESLTFLIIGGTVFLQGGTAQYVGRFLNVVEPDPTGFLFVGANQASRQLAKAIQNVGFDVLMLDTNKANCRNAKQEGLDTVHADALSPETFEDIPLEGIGNLIAMTPNAEVNILACQQGAKVFGTDHIFRIRLQDESEDQTEEKRLRDEGILLFDENLTLNVLQQRLNKGKSFYCHSFDKDEHDGEEKPEPTHAPLFFVKNDHLELVAPDIDIPDGAQTVCFGEAPPPESEAMEIKGGLDDEFTTDKE